MRKSFKVAATALSLAAAAAVAVPAQAQVRYDRGNRDKTALAAGVAGLIIGGALASGGNRGNYGDNNYGYAQPYGYGQQPYGYYDQGYNYGPSYGYGYQQPRYYGQGYGYGYSRRTCVVRQRVFDPYLGRYVRVRHRVPC